MKKGSFLAVIIVLSMLIFPTVVNANPGPHDDGYITLDDTHLNLHYWAQPGYSGGMYGTGTIPNAWAWNDDLWYLTIATTGNAQVKIDWFDYYPTNDVYELWVDGVKMSTNVAGASGTWTGWLNKGTHNILISWIYYQTNQTPISGGSYYSIEFTVLGQLIPVDIDIKPGSDTNPINLGSNGIVPVAILGSAVFDASEVNPATVQLAGAAARVKGKSGSYGSLQDVNGDGYLDLVVQVNTETLELSEGAAIADVTGFTNSGLPFKGTDSITIVPPQ